MFHAKNLQRTYKKQEFLAIKLEDSQKRARKITSRLRTYENCCVYNYTKNCTNEKTYHSCGTSHGRACALCLGSHITGHKTHPKYQEIKIQELKNIQHLTKVKHSGSTEVGKD